jgi:hypothetical protein
MTTYLSSSYYGGIVVQAHEETEVHDEYDNHTHEESSTHTTTHTTTTRAGGNSNGESVQDSWSFCTTTIPTPLSDVSIAKMTLQPDGPMGIVLTGGCNSPNGNELVMEEWGEGFSCKNITSQVRKRVSPIHSLYIFLFVQLFFFFLFTKLHIFHFYNYIIIIVLSTTLSFIIYRQLSFYP